RSQRRRRAQQRGAGGLCPPAARSRAHDRHPRGETAGRRLHFQSGRCSRGKTGRYGGAGQLRLTTRVTALFVNANTAPGSAMDLNLGLTTLDLRVGGGTPLARTPADARERLKAIFENADQDKNGSLDANEARSVAGWGARFKLMDVDDDGKLTEKELFA